METEDDMETMEDFEDFDEVAWRIKQEKQFYSDINSTEIDLAEKFSKADNYSKLYFPRELSEDQLQKYIFVLEDGFKILIHDDSFTKLFQFLKSCREPRDRQTLIVYHVYEYIINLSRLYQKNGETEKAKMKIRMITKFCLLAISRHKISAKYTTIRTTCQTLSGRNKSLIKELDMMHEILEEIVKIMKSCEKDKPRDFGHFRLLKGHILSELGKPKEALSEYEKAKEIFRKLVFNWIDKKGKKPKDENVLAVVCQMASAYKTSEYFIFNFWKQKKEYLKAINVFERFVKKNEVIKMFVMSMKPEVESDAIEKRYLMNYFNEERLELGRLYFEVKNYPMALLHFKIVIEEDCERIEDQIFRYKNGPRDEKLRFRVMNTTLTDFKTFDLLDMVIRCQEKLDFVQDNQQKSDIYLTPDMELIWQKETGMTQEQMYEDYDHYEDLLNATVSLCMKTYWTQIHRVNLNEFYYRHLQKIRVPKGFYNETEQDKTKAFQFSLNVINKLKSQANKKYLSEFYPIVYSRYIDDKCYEEAMDILMEWLDYKERDFDWNLKMINCLSEKRDYKEVEPYLIDCLEIIEASTKPGADPDYKWEYFDLYTIFQAASRVLFYQHDNSYPLNPLLENFFQIFLKVRSSLDSNRMGRYSSPDAIVLYDYVKGTFLQKIGSYDNKSLTVKLVKLASLSAQRREIIIDLVTILKDTNTCFFDRIWRHLFKSEYSLRSLQDEVLKALMENYECLNENQENVRLFANSCFLARCLKNKAIS